MSKVRNPTGRAIQRSNLTISLAKRSSALAAFDAEPPTFPPLVPDVAVARAVAAAADRELAEVVRKYDEFDAKYADEMALLHEATTDLEARKRQANAEHWQKKVQELCEPVGRAEELSREIGRASCRERV